MRVRADNLAPDAVSGLISILDEIFRPSIISAVCSIGMAQCRGFVHIRKAVNEEILLPCRRAKRFGDAIGP